MSERTKGEFGEPWVVVDHTSDIAIRRQMDLSGVKLVAKLYCDNRSMYADAARIIACVNALEGLNPEAIPEVFNLFRQANMLIQGHYHPEDAEDLHQMLKTEMPKALANLKASETDSE